MGTRVSEAEKYIHKFISFRPRLPPPKDRRDESDDNNNQSYLRPDSLIYDTVTDGHSLRSHSPEPQTPRRFKTEARIELVQGRVGTVTSI